MTTSRATLQIVSTVLLMAGLFMLWVGGTRAYEAYSSLRWPTITGAITRARVETRQSGGDNRSYRPQIEYAFVLGDEDYWGQRIRFDPEPKSDNRASAEARIDDFPKDSAVEIYYNPNRPERNMLEPSFSLTKLIYPAAGLVVLLAGLRMRMVTRSK